MLSIEDSDKLKARNRSWDRVFVLVPKTGEKTKNAAGLVDSRLFNGTNRLHAIRDNETCLWGLKYDSGSTPIPLKQQFTSFAKLEAYVRDYFTRRNVEIKEILD